MSKLIGREIEIGIGRETSRGTPVASSYWIPRRGFDFGDKATVLIDNQSYGVIEDSTGNKIVSKWGEGTLEGVVRDRAIGLLFLNAIGTAIVVNTPEATLYTHTFTVLQDHQHPSITLYVQDPRNSTEVDYPLCMIKTLEISADVNEFVVFSADLISQKGQSATGTPTYIAENEFVASEVSVYFADTQGELGTATAVKVRSASIIIDKDIEKDDILGSSDPDDFLNKSMKVSVSLSKTYNGTTYKDFFLAGTPKAMRIEITSSVTIGASTNPKITIDLNKVTITDWSKDKDLDGIVMENLDMKAHFKIADSKMIQVVLINEVEKYI